MSVCSGLFAHCPECGGEVPVEADHDSCPPFKYIRWERHVCNGEPNQEGLRKAREEAMRDMGFFSEGELEDWRRIWRERRVRRKLRGAVA